MFQQPQQLQLEQYSIALFYERMEPLISECKITGKSSVQRGNKIGLLRARGC